MTYTRVGKKSSDLERMLTMKLVKQLVTLAFSIFLASLPAFAGDFAKRDILGFSVDGELFAYEESGIQDGSGFPYSTIYIINTASDTWVSGSPYRALIENEQASIKDAKQLVGKMAGAALNAITQPGTINATNQPLELVDNPHRMVARPWHFVPPTNERIEFRIEQYRLAGQDFCNDFGPVQGFRLIQIFAEDGGITKQLHEDTAIPKSRGCPLDYRFADIVSYRAQSSNKYVVAVLILYETVGFEGPDGRFLAITKQYPLN